MTQCVRHGAFFILLISGMTMAAFGVPGHVTPDAIQQIYEGTTGQFNSFHPPVTSTIWAQLYHLGYRVWPYNGVWPIVALQILLLLGGVWLVVQRGRNPFILPALAIAALWPPIVSFQGVVVKDVTFADLAILGFLLLHHLATSGLQDRSRVRTIVTIGAALLAFTLAACTRQQGVFILLAGIIAAILIGSRLSDGLTKVQLARVGAPVLIASFVLWSALAKLPEWITGNRPPDGTRAGLYEIMNYDIAGILHRVPDLDLSRLAAVGYDLDRYRAGVAQAYTGEGSDEFYRVPGYKLTNDPRKIGQVLFPGVLSVWSDGVRHHFPEYLAHRLDNFSWLLGFRGEARCVPIYVNVEGSPDMAAAMGFTRRLDPKDTDIYMALKPLTETLIYRHWAYALLTIAQLIYLIATYRPGDEAAIGLASAALAMTASFLVFGITCEFRYLYFPLVASLVLPVLIATRNPKDRGSNSEQNIPVSVPSHIGTSLVRQQR
jgi:hypothetical protein